MSCLRQSLSQQLEAEGPAHGGGRLERRSPAGSPGTGEGTWLEGGGGHQIFVPASVLSAGP